jgi:hypothetical protein
MSITKRLTIENVNLDDEQEMDALVDRMFSVGLERVRAERDELASLREAALQAVQRQNVAKEHERKRGRGIER